MTAVLAHVHKKRTFARSDELVFEAHGTPTVTHTMVSASLLCRQFDPCSICSASGRPLRTMSDHQTLRVCGEVVRNPFGHPCCATCRLTKRYVCAASALPAVEASDDSSIRTRRRPPNATHVMVSAFSQRLRQTLSKHMKYQQFISGLTRLSFSGSQTCAVVRSGDRAFWRLAFKSCATSKT
jgi:hypothetical protein